MSDGLCSSMDDSDFWRAARLLQDHKTSFPNLVDGPSIVIPVMLLKLNC